MTINFIKTLKYETKPQNGDVFEYLSKLTMQEIDPPSTSDICIQTNSKIVFHSPLKRVIQTLELKSDTQYIETDKLKEILFNLKELCTKQEWEKEKSEIVRERFKTAFINDQLPIKRVIIFDEIKEVLNDCLSQDTDNVTVISHSFRLKLIQAFIETQGKIINNPHLIHRYIEKDKKTFEFGGGFSVQKENLFFLLDG